MEQESGHQWLQWWTQTFWQQADPGWHHLPFFQLEPPFRERLALTQPAALTTLLALPDALPGLPDPRVLTLSSASPARRRRMMLLVGEICQRDYGAHELDDEQRLWCQRISRALRPGLWLPPSLSFWPDPQPAALALLAAVFPVSCWFRLRLSFDFQAVNAFSDVAATLPSGKAQALWEAAIWRSQQQEEQ